MLTIFGQKQRFCDGISRRSFLQIGSFTFGAASLTLADILRAEARARATSNGHKAVINIFLGGGPPHQDMWDIKTEAPVEIRGEFKPIATKVPGIQIGEYSPRLPHAWINAWSFAPSSGPPADTMLSNACPVGRIRVCVRWAADQVSVPSPPSCKGRLILQCRLSWVSPRGLSMCRGPIPAAPASSAHPTPLSSPTVRAWPT
jgi:hypothetical protein